MIPVTFPLIHGDVPRPFYTTPPTPDGSIPLVISDSNNNNNQLNNLILAGPHPGVHPGVAIGPAGVHGMPHPGVAIGPAGVHGMPHPVPFPYTGPNDLGVIGSFGRNMPPQMNPMNMPPMGMYPPGVPNPFNTYGGPYGGPPPIAILSVDPTRRFSNQAARDAYDGIKKHLGSYSKKNSDNQKVVWIEKIGGRKFVHKLMDRDNKVTLIDTAADTNNKNTFLETSFFLPDDAGTPAPGKVTNGNKRDLQNAIPLLVIDRDPSMPTHWKIMVRGESLSYNYWVISQLLVGNWGDGSRIGTIKGDATAANIADDKTSTNKTAVEAAGGFNQVINKT